MPWGNDDTLTDLGCGSCQNWPHGSSPGQSWRGRGHEKEVHGLSPCLAKHLAKRLRGNSKNYPTFSDFWIKHDLNIRPGVYPDDLWPGCLPSKYKESQVDEPTNTFWGQSFGFRKCCNGHFFHADRFDLIDIQKVNNQSGTILFFGCLWTAACITKEGWSRNSAWKIWR